MSAPQQLGLESSEELKSFHHGKMLGELHRHVDGEDGGLGGGYILGNSTPRHVVLVTAIDEAAGLWVLVAGLADRADIDDLLPFRADGSESGDVECKIFTFDEHGRLVGVGDEADRMLLGRVPSSGSRFEDIPQSVRVR